MARCCDHARAGKNKFKPSRREIIHEKFEAAKEERRASRFERLREKLFPTPKFTRVAAVRQTGTHNYRVAAGARIPANAEITRGELSKILRAAGFDGLRFTDGKRVLSLA